MSLFRIRNLTSASEELGLNATLPTYAGAPLMVDEPQPDWLWNNDLNAERACKFSITVFNRNKNNDTVYGDYLYLRDNLRDDYAIEFDLD